MTGIQLPGAVVLRRPAPDFPLDECHGRLVGNHHRFLPVTLMAKGDSFPGRRSASSFRLIRSYPAPTGSSHPSSGHPATLARSSSIYSNRALHPHGKVRLTRLAVVADKIPVTDRTSLKPIHRCHQSLHPRLVGGVECCTLLLSVSTGRKPSFVFPRKTTAALFHDAHSPQLTRL